MADLPNEIPTVRVTGTYRGWDGRALKGTVTFTGPGLTTFAESDLFIAGPVVCSLDESGQIIDASGNRGVRLPATDSPDMNPTGWAYTVKENLTGISGARTYSLLLPKDTPDNSIDLADVAPADPSTPTYVPVPGLSAYEVAVAEGFAGTEAEWLESLEGPVGPQGQRGETGATGERGADGLSAYAVAVTEGFAGTEAEWLESLIGPEGPQGPAGADGAGAGTVTAVNSVEPDGSGNVTLTAASVGAVASVNGKTGQSVTLAAADVGALATSARGASNGVASLVSGKVPTDQLPAGIGGAKNVWTPQALGFEAWSCDPFGVANPVAKYLTPQRLYLTGIHITENTTVNRIIMWSRGYGGVSTNRYRAGIYRENGTGTGTKVVESASVALSMAGQEAGSMPAQKDNHIGAVPITIASTTLTPGRYWVAWDLVTGAASDFAFFHVQNESPISAANFFMTTSPWARAWYVGGQTTLPATLDQSATGSLANHDIPILALANV
ncbi:hypothetical protein [Streptomyces sp. DHE17-7]|uniref:hypothetical protein n=1 Tax=Streptomyces sp. DHE17-7 TaxID=2759949 RepID=UPI0022EA3AFD|nr:hypothetical protein [Streptomyces sp. DHE17-7]MBJ6623629.1 collagen-like protein [Streptomyces sp. DHE17-7]